MHSRLLDIWRGWVPQMIEICTYLIGPNEVVLREALIVRLAAWQFAKRLDREPHVERRTTDCLLEGVEADPLVVRLMCR